MINPVLYILMRSDMESLNPGKAMAQAAHAANQFGNVLEAALSVDDDPKEKELFSTWKYQADGFGTTIVLDVHNEILLTAIIDAVKETHYAGLVIDPTYPLKDGIVCHEFPLATCGWVFAERGSVPLLHPLELYK